MSSEEDTVYDNNIRNPLNNKATEADERTVVDENGESHSADGDTPLDKAQSPTDGISAEQSPSKKDKMKSRIRYAAGLGGAAVAGAGMAYVSEAMKGDPSGPPTDLFSESAKDFVNKHIDNQPDEVPAWSDGRIAVATGDFDDMSFSQAFAAARSQVGAGGAFEWHGKVYGTYLHDEWHNMSAAEHAEFDSHFSWSKNFNPIDTNDGNEITAAVAEDADNDDITADVVEDDDNEITVNVVEGPNGMTVNVLGDTSEVEVLGVATDNEVGSDIPVLSVDENPVVMVDLDNDGIVDIIGSDIDNNGIISGDELLNLDDGDLAMNDLDSLNDNNMDMDIDMSF